MGTFIVAANAGIVTSPSQLELPGTMTGHHSTRTLLTAIVLMGWPAAMAYAQTATAAGPEGTYCLRGVHEVGSCLRLAGDSTFEYFLAYGAYDENSRGHWKADGADVVLDSPPYDNAPTFTFKRFERAEGDGFDIAVVNTAGDRINGINVRATCDGRAVDVGVTGAAGSAEAEPVAKWAKSENSSVA